MKNLKKPGIAVFKVLGLFKKTVEAVHRLEHQNSCPAHIVGEEDKKIWREMTNRDKAASMQKLWELCEILTSETDIAAHPLIIATALQLLWEYGYPADNDLNRILKELLPEEAENIEWGPKGKTKEESR